ncbi:MAG: hypothetical protein KAI83_12480 [Thiomargarita sp.]|nr:hypothetical protein [Thiomargarita sp.]
MFIELEYVISFRRAASMPLIKGEHALRFFIGSGVQRFSFGNLIPRFQS